MVERSAARYAERRAATAVDGASAANRLGAPGGQRPGAVRARSTTLRTCIWPAAGWCRRTTPHWGWTSCGRARSSIAWPASIFSLEMSKSEIVMRLLSAEAKIKLADMRSGRMNDDDWTRLARRMSEISEAPLYIDDSPNLTMMEIRAKARRLRQKADLKLVVVDYLQLMTSGKKVEITAGGSLRVLAASQAFGQGARGSGGRDQPAQPRSRAAHRQEADAVRPSRIGLLEQDADMVILLNRPDAFERTTRAVGKRISFWPNTGNGPTKTVTVAAPAAPVALHQHGEVAVNQRHGTYSELPPPWLSVGPDDAPSTPIAPGGGSWCERGFSAKRWPV